MALKFISPESNDSGNDVPWVNEYVEAGGNTGDSFPVIKIISGSKGYTVVTSAFKGFIFAKSQMHKFLAEALTAWITNSTINYPLFAVASKDGKIQLAIDDELEPSSWVQDGKFYEQKLKKTQGSGLTGNSSNPLLPTPPLTSGGGRKGR